MLDGKSKTTHTISKIPAEGLSLGMWGEYDVGVLCYLVAVLERPVVDVRAEMEEQPRLRASIGYYYRVALAFTKEHEDKLAELVLRLYNVMHGVKYNSGTSAMAATAKESLGRFSEKLVMARALQEPEYMAQKTIRDKAQVIADVLGEVRDAFTSRGRFLEQISNNERMDSRGDREERPAE